MVVLNYKYEIYIPDSYIYNGKIEYYSDDKVDEIVKYIISNYDISGVSIKEESGYYNSSIGLTKMKNSIVYFYTDKGNIDLSYIKQFLPEQETVLVVKDNIGMLI